MDIPEQHDTLHPLKKAQVAGADFNATGVKTPGRVKKLYRKKAIQKLEK